MKEKPIATVPLKTTALMMAGTIAAFAAGTYVARAGSGGSPSSAISFAGTIRQNGQPVTVAQTLTFQFKKAGVDTCSSSPLTVTPDETGAFQVPIPLTACPDSLFDGSAVTMNLLVGDVAVATDQPVNPVPYAKYAEHVGTPDCPVGYDRDGTLPQYIVCRRGFDEVVRVGTGASAFWVDRYEASIWSSPDGSGTQYGPDYPIAKNGQSDNLVQAFAVSKAGVPPGAFVTWFQAGFACRRNGKRLLYNEEWQEAARGTPDPGPGAGSDGSCATDPLIYRRTGLGTNCRSVWGMEDAIGNYFEWVAEWQSAPQADADINGIITATWPEPELNGDDITGIASGGFGDPNYDLSVPSGVLRGGASWSGNGAGVFSYNVANSPIATGPQFGFRCMIPR